MDNEEFQNFCLSGANEQACIRLFQQARWPDGFRCPQCGGSDAYSIRTRRLPLYECRSCGTQTSLTVGTILEGSRTPVRLWLLALRLHAAPNGINAVRLASIIGTTYKTAWLICHKIRHAMSQADKNELLSGLVRINFAQYGRPYNPTVFRHPQEQPLLIGASMNAQGIFTYIKIKQAIEECSYPHLTCPLNKHPFLNKHVSPEATEVIAVTLKISRDRNIRLIQLCQTASNWINYTFSGIGPKHLQAYMDQFCFQYNWAAQERSPFEALVQMSLSASVITYPELIRKPNIQPKLRTQYNALLREAC